MIICPTFADLKRLGVGTASIYMQQHCLSSAGNTLRPKHPPCPSFHLPTIFLCHFHCRLLLILYLDARARALLRHDDVDLVACAATLHVARRQAVPPPLVILAYPSISTRVYIPLRKWYEDGGRNRLTTSELSRDR